MTHHIVILGAGYAGLTAARQLRGTDARLTVVNRTAHFVERVRLHQLAAGQNLRYQPLDGVIDTVTGINLDTKTVHCDTTTLNYDTLVYALGSGADLDTVPGVREHAFSVAEPHQAQRISDHPAGAIVVVGGGLTGIEVATELAEARPHAQVELVSDTPIGGWLSDRARRHLHRAFARMRVTPREGHRVTKVGPNGLLLDNGDELHAEMVVWAAGFRVPTLAAEAGLAVDRHGRVLVDDRLRSVSHPDVYAIGDVAAAPTPGGTETRMSCQTALPMGQYVAKEIARTLHGHASKPIRIRYVWQNISLGRRDGVTQFTRADDSPLNLVLTGRPSAWFKEAITRGAAWKAQH